MTERDRRLVLVEDATSPELRALPTPCLVIAPPDAEPPAAPAEARRIDPRGLARLLGTTWRSATLDARRGLDPDLLGQVHGLIARGGVVALILGPSASSRSERRLRRLLATSVGAAPATAPDSPSPQATADSADHEADHEAVGQAPDELRLASDRHGGQREIRAAAPRPAPTAEQAAFLIAARDLLAVGLPCAVVLEAHRGRGKSAAVGLLLQHLAAHPEATSGGPLYLASGSAEGLSAVTAFLGPEGCAAVRLTTPEALCDDAGAKDGDGYLPPVIAIDEAAAVPLPRLRRILARYPDARLVFATTTHGYEGTGRGFVLRFLAWLAEARPSAPMARLTLAAPVRWDADDTLEPRVFAALGLDAEPAPRAAFGSAPRLEDAQFVTYDRDRLVQDEPRLREIFGLLLHAHYRTTPRDLATILDAPDLSLHALELGGRVAAVCLVALEPPMGDALARQAAAGEVRLPARALGDNLAVHLGLDGVGDLTLVRSVRIATHPDLRRLGLASRLVDSVHAAFPDADLFGTLFGATAATVNFRRGLGYEVARVSASRGVRSGEPSVLMLRPVTPRGAALLAEARAAFARNWSPSRGLLEADGVVLERDLTAALEAGLTGAHPPLARAAVIDLARRWCDSPRTFESEVAALQALVLAETSALAQLPAPLGAIVEGRVLRGLGWDATARAAGLPHAGIAMRQLRRAIRALLDSVDLADAATCGSVRGSLP